MANTEKENETIIRLTKENGDLKRGLIDAAEQITTLTIEAGIMKNNYDAKIKESEKAILILNDNALSDSAKLAKIEALVLPF